jgi:hypothetical protein
MKFSNAWKLLIMEQPVRRGENGNLNPTGSERTWKVKEKVAKGREYLGYSLLPICLRTPPEGESMV